MADHHEPREPPPDLIKVLPTDVEETARVFDLLLGDNLAGRKEHIAQHGAEYLDDLDVS